MSQNIREDPIEEPRKGHNRVPLLSLSSAPSPLEIPELLKIILDILPVSDSVSAARVCQAWKEPALNRIWHRIYSLVTLFRLIGPMTKGPDNGLIFSGDIMDADWSRYAVYAPRIREVTFTDCVGAGEPWISPQCIQSMSDHLPPQLRWPRPVFIHLNTIFTTSAGVLGVIPLISLSLRKLTWVKSEYSFFNPSPESIHYVQSVIGALAECERACLEEIELNCNSDGATFVDTLKPCLNKHGSRITSFTGHIPFDARVWVSIFDLPALQTLYIAHYNHDGPGTLEQIMPMIPKLVERQPQLRRFRLYSDLPFRGDESHSNSVYSQLIRDLMGLRNLETLKLSVTLRLSLTDSEVQQMGESWPNMRVLELQDKSTWRTLDVTGGQPVAPQINLSLLSSFLRGFPRLEELNVPFICDKLLVAPEEGFPTSPLQTLHVEGCPTPEVSPEKMVAYLAFVLPPAVRLVDRNGHLSVFWHQVARGLAELREGAKPPRYARILECGP